MGTGSVFENSPDLADTTLIKSRLEISSPL